MVPILCMRIIKVKKTGSVGLTTDFYNMFWKDIKVFLLQSFQFALDSGSLSTEQKRGILNIILKKRKTLDILKIGALYHYLTLTTKSLHNF